MSLARCASSDGLTQPRDRALVADVPCAAAFTRSRKSYCEYASRGTGERRRVKLRPSSNPLLLRSRREILSLARSVGTLRQSRQEMKSTEWRLDFNYQSRFIDSFKLVQLAHQLTQFRRTRYRSGHSSQRANHCN